MTKKKILPSLIKVNIFALSTIFISVVSLNVYLAFNIKNYDRISYFIHDYADLAQYSITLVSQKANLKSDKDETEMIKSMIRFEEDLKSRVKSRKNHFLKIYSEEELIAFNKSLSNMQSISVLSKDENRESLLESLEDDYVYILTFSGRHHQRVENFFSTFMTLLIGLLAGIISFVIFMMIKKIKGIIDPLKYITDVSQNLSISKSGASFEQNYDYDEYRILCESLQEMHKRIHFENRVSSHESASESIGHFAENLAHSINNPLAIIGTTVKILNKKAKKNNNLVFVDQTNEILNEINRITDITHKMKTLINTTDKMAPENFKAFNIITTINLLFLNRFFEKKIQFFYDKDINLNIYGKEDIISQIVGSLVENSILYNDNKKPKIEIIFEDLKNTYLIHIRDNGNPPAQEFIDRHMNGENGEKALGLYAAKKLALENGYKLTYFSHPVKEFTLELPKEAFEITAESA